MSRVIFHIDANSAYLSWEAVYRLQQGSALDLRTIPSVVGGDPKKRNGIVLAKSVPAKKYGIKTGESLMEARKKCPMLFVVPPNYSLYMKSSNAMIELLKTYSPQIQRFSVDECFLDFSGMDMIFEDPVTVAEEIRERIHKELGFTVSIGISSNKLLAKMGGELNSVNGVCTLWPHEIEQKWWPLPVEELFMVGRSTLPKLHRLNVYTIGDLAQYDPEVLAWHLKSHGQLIWEYANGREDSLVKRETRLQIKGIGNSTTIAFNVDTHREAHLILLSLVETVSTRLRSSGFCARVITVSIRTDTFENYSHQRKFLVPTDTTQQIFEYAKALFNEMWKGEPIRHLGIRVTEFCSNEFLQLSLLENHTDDRHRLLDQTIDQLRLKYEDRTIIRSCFLHSGIKPLAGGVSEDDYPVMSSLL